MTDGDKLKKEIRTELQGTVKGIQNGLGKKN
jgi:hypothetical protein